MLLNRTISDKIIVGSIAGLIAGTVMELINLVLYYLNYSQLRALDFAIILTKRQPAEDFSGIISGFLTHLLFAVIVGVILSLILAYTDHKFSFLKGASIGFGTNFSFLVGASLFELDKIIETSMLTIIIFYFTAIVYGLVAAFILNYFHKNLEYI